MALITDPDQLLQGTEVTFDKVALTMGLNLAGNLSEDGVTGQAYYSFCKEEWLNEVNDLHKYTFPMLAITPEQFEVGNNGSKFSNWTWLDDPTRKLLRTAGWREYDNTGITLREYLGVITLGNIDATDKTTGDKVYYAFASDTASTEFIYAGAVNEAVQVFGDATNGNFDKRADVLTVYIREQGKTYGQSTTTDIGVNSITYKVERFPLTEATDLKITNTDADITTLAPYTGMSITYHQLPQSETIGGGNFDFGITIDGNNGTAEQIYEFVQYTLRQTADADSEADAPTQPGNLQDELLRFVGDNLETLAATNSDGGGTGVFINNFDSNDTNRITFTDNADATQQFPFVSGFNLNFNTNVVNDTAAKYWLFFTDAGGNTIESDSAIIVNNNAGVAITGTVAGVATIASDFDFDGNVQGGRTAGTDANAILKVIGLTTAQYAEIPVTITRAVNQNFSITASLERNYVNP